MVSLSNHEIISKEENVKELLLIAACIFIPMEGLRAVESYRQIDVICELEKADFTFVCDMTLAIEHAQSTR